MKIEEHPGSSTISIEQIDENTYRITSDFDGESIAVSASGAWELLEALYLARNELFALAHDLQSAPGPESLAHGTERSARDEHLTKIAQHVAWAVADTEQAILLIEAANMGPHEKRRRTDNAMVAMLEIVTPILPEPVQVEVKRLIALHDEAWRLPSTENGPQPDTVLVEGRLAKEG